MPERKKVVPAKDIVHFFREELQSLLYEVGRNIYSDEFKKKTGLQKIGMKYDEEKWKRIEEYYVEYPKRAMDFLDTDEVISPLRKAIEQRKKVHEEWFSFVEKCEALTQLFIAV